MKTILITTAIAAVAAIVFHVTGHDALRCVACIWLAAGTLSAAATSITG